MFCLSLLPFGFVMCISSSWFIDLRARISVTHTSRLLAPFHERGSECHLCTWPPALVLNIRTVFLQGQTHPLQLFGQCLHLLLEDCLQQFVIWFNSNDFTAVQLLLKLVTTDVQELFFYGQLRCRCASNPINAGTNGTSNITCLNDHALISKVTLRGRYLRQSRFWEDSLEWLTLLAVTTNRECRSILHKTLIHNYTTQSFKYEFIIVL